MKLSWVQAWRSSLSLPEVAISLSPGLISLNHTHLPLITLLSCSSSSWTIYTPHSRPSAWLNCICEFVCLCDQHAGDTCTVLLFYVSQLPNCFFFGRVGLFVFIKAFFPCIWTQTLINGDLSHRPWQNLASKHGSSRENSALWSDYRLSEDGPWDLSSSHSKGADGTPSEVNGSAPAGDRGRRFCPDILDFGSRAKL